MKPFHLFTEILGWLQIAASPLLAGLLIGFVVVLAMPGNTGLVIAGVLALAGLITGIIWAGRVWRNRGTVNFMSRIMATPELDEGDRRPPARRGGGTEDGRRN
jgi:hypothetical protein